MRRILFLAVIVSAVGAAAPMFAQGAAAPAQAPAAAAAPAGDAQKGKQLFTNDGCYQCHNFEGQGGSAGARLAPKPMGFEALKRYVRHPRGQMPPYTAKVVSDQDLADMYAYLSSIPPAPDVKTIPMLAQ